MKKILFTLIIVLFVSVQISARAEDVLDFKAEELELLSGYTSFGELIDAIVSGSAGDYDGIFERLMSILTREIKGAAAYTSAIIAFALLSACIKGFKNNIPSDSGEVAFLICYCVSAAFLLGILKTAVSVASETAENVISFVKMSVPAYIAITCATAPMAGAANMEGIFILMVNVVSSFAGGFMLNMFFWLGLLYIINHMSTEIHVLKLIELVRQAMFWILGFILTIFAGMAGLSGITASVASESGMKAVKYTVGHTVPIVGGFLADSAEMIMSSAKIFKNAFGTAGIIILFCICLIPVIKLFAMGMLLKAAAGLTEPFCDKRISDCTASIGQTVIHIMICVILVCVMFIFTVSVILLAGMGG